MLQFYLSYLTSWRHLYPAKSSDKPEVNTKKHVDKVSNLASQQFNIFYVYEYVETEIKVELITGLNTCGEAGGEMINAC